MRLYDLTTIKKAIADAQREETIKHVLLISEV
jgi:hypothetical protein